MDKHRPGITAPEYPPVTLLLSRKSPKPYNILVGSGEPLQVRFAEQALGMPCRPAERVDDASLLEGGPCLLSVTTGRVVDLSDAVRARASMWSLGPVRRGSAAALAIARHAASLLGREPGREEARAVADELAAGGVGDIRAAVWRAAWLLLGPPPQGGGRWKEPWEHRTGWLPPGVDPSYRLNALFRDLRAWAFLANGEEASVRKAGLSVSPSKARYLSGLRLDPARAAETARAVAAWRAGRGDPWACALKVAAAWRN